jgi:hypothetical protein
MNIQILSTRKYIDNSGMCDAPPICLKGLSSISNFRTKSSFLSSALDRSFCKHCNLLHGSISFGHVIIKSPVGYYIVKLLWQYVHIVTVFAYYYINVADRDIFKFIKLVKSNQI